MEIKARIVFTNDYKGENWFVLQDEQGRHYGASEEAFVSKKRHWNLGNLYVGRQVVIQEIRSSQYNKIATVVST